MKRFANLITYCTLLTVAVSLFILCPFACSKKEPKPEVIRIGAILPLTGEAAKYGESTKKGIDLAVKEINSEGGIKGQKLFVIYEDSKADPKDGVSALRKLVTVDKVRAVLGAMSSSVTLAIAPIAEKHGVVLLSPASSAPAITNAGDYIFRNCYSDSYEGEKMAQYVHNETEYRKIAIVHINNDYGLGLTQAFSAEFLRSGGKIVATELYDFGATDFRSQITKIKDAKPEAVYLVGYGEMARFLVQATELGLSVPFFSCIMFEDPDILKVAGKSAEGAVYTFPSYDPGIQEETVRKFVDSFENEYGQKPDGFAANAYDAMKILAVALSEGGNKSQEIKRSLCTIENYPGVTGKTTFDENGDVIKPIGIKQVIDCKFEWLCFKY